MIRWNDLPFLRAAIGLIVGILFANRLPINSWSWLMTISLFFFATILLLNFRTISKLKKSLLAATTFFCFIALGFCVMQFNILDEKLPVVFENQISDVNYYSLEIISTPDKTKHSVRYEACILNAMVENGWQPVGKKAIIYFKDTTGMPLRYGERLLVKGDLTILQKAQNPHIFDYSLYLNRKGIRLQGYIHHYQSMPGNSLPSLMQLAAHTADRFEEVLNKFIKSDREASIARAMILGRRNDIAPEMEFAYQATGTSHILAVSGLHVGIIYFAFATLLSFLNVGRVRIIYFICIFVGVWAFAIITGLSPSVQRAATMFSFFLAARMLNRTTSINNIILASAFFVLLFSPALVYSVSFQLSYLAVFGIVILYNPIYRLFSVRNRILNFFWQITVLSIAVQVATFPVTIYYFNQFPALFALTNLFAIPTATVVMISGMILLALSAVAPLGSVIGFILSSWIRVYNELMIYLGGLEITAVENLNLKLPVVLLLLVLTAFLVRFIQARQLVYFQFFTIVLVAVLGFSALDNYSARRQERLTFYSIGNKLVYDVFLGRTCFTKNAANAAEEEFNIWPNRRFHGINELKPISELSTFRTGKHFELVMLNGKVFLFLSDAVPNNLMIPFKIDFLITKANTLLKYPHISADKIILHGTTDLLFKNPNSEKAPEIHSIKNQGALAISL